MPRTFTPEDLRTLTNTAYLAMSDADQHAFDIALADLWAMNYVTQTTAELARGEEIVGGVSRDEMGA